MAPPVVGDFIKETSATSGTGTLNLDGNTSGFRSFFAVLGAVEVCYSITTASGEFETGLGTITSGSPDTLSRDTVYSSSNSNALVNFSGETLTVFCSAPADWLIGHKTKLTRAAAQSIPHATTTKIIFDTKEYDVGGIGDIVTNFRGDIVRDGRYLVIGHYFAGLTSGEALIAMIYLNGSLHKQFKAWSGGDNTGVIACIVDDFVAGDFLELHVWQNSGGNLNTETPIHTRPMLSITEMK